MKSIKEQWDQQQRKAIDTYIKWAGDAATLGKLLGESTATVSNWVARGRMSARAACKAERIEGSPLTKEQVRPDVQLWDCAKYLGE